MSYEVTLGDYDFCGYCEDCKVIDRAYQQGRTDAIDKCLSAIEHCVTGSECRELLEQLKEQKNDD